MKTTGAASIAVVLASASVPLAMGSPAPSPAPSSFLESYAKQANDIPCGGVITAPYSSGTMEFFNCFGPCENDPACPASSTTAAAATANPTQQPITFLVPTASASSGVQSFLGVGSAHDLSGWEASVGTTSIDASEMLTVDATSIDATTTKTVHATSLGATTTLTLAHATTVGGGAPKTVTTTGSPASVTVPAVNAAGKQGSVDAIAGVVAAGMALLL